ncbi:hypothetical protein SLS58_003448 [Diplodia intermedia]|uniref:Viral a-type inclusion protein n=1 Tax=Diplodia intermedia TaxID=856260 RepID=A0ABR3TW27_9PEZI
MDPAGQSDYGGGPGAQSHATSIVRQKLRELHYHRKTGEEATEKHKKLCADLYEHARLSVTVMDEQAEILKKQFTQLRQLDGNIELEWDKMENLYEMNDKFFEKMHQMEKTLLCRVDQRWLKAGVENHTLNEKMARLQEVVAKSEEVETSLRAENAALIQEKTALEQDTATLAEENTGLGRELQSMKERKAYYKKKLDEHQKRLEEYYRIQPDRAISSKAASEAECDATMAENANLKQDLDQCRAQINQAKTEFDGATKKKDAKLLALSNEVRQLHIQRDATTAENLNLRQEAERCRAQLDQAKADSDTATKEHENAMISLRNEVDELLDQLGEVKADRYYAANSEKVQVEKDLATETKKSEEQARSLAELTVTMANLKKELDNSNLQRSQITTVNEQLMTSTKLVIEQLASTSEEVNVLSREVRQRKEELDTSKVDVAKLSARVDELETDLSEAQNRENAFKDQIRTTSQNQQAAETALGKVKLDLSEANEKLKAAHADLNVSRIETRLAEEETAGFRAANRSLKQSRDEHPSSSISSSRSAIEGSQSHSTPVDPLSRNSRDSASGTENEDQPINTGEDPIDEPQSSTMGAKKAPQKPKSNDKAKRREPGAAGMEAATGVLQEAVFAANAELKLDDFSEEVKSAFTLRVGELMEDSRIDFRHFKSKPHRHNCLAWELVILPLAQDDTDDSASERFWVATGPKPKKRRTAAEMLLD